LGVVPLPRHFRAPGLARAGGSGEIRPESTGWIRRMNVQSGAPVAVNQEVLRLENPELNVEIAAAEAEVEQALARERQMLRELPAGIEPMRLRREAVEARLEQLIKDRAHLTVVSPVAGHWSPLGEEDPTGTWLARGALIGQVVGNGPDWEFLAVVPQDDAGELFSATIRGGEIRFPGAAGEVLKVNRWSVVPGRQDTLPTPALGWGASGPVRTQLEDSRGVRTAEPFFLVIAHVSASDRSGPLWQGRTGYIRFDLPPMPLLVRWGREFRQMLQRRYQI
jgi:putative peptide zinc metalloprotease protein